MKIQSIDCLGLFGKSPKGGWTNEIKPEDSIHALVVVRTDDGVVGVGSVFTDARLVEAALAVLRPLCIGESAIEPMRVSEKLHQNTFRMGHGASITHAISGIDIEWPRPWHFLEQGCTARSHAGSGPDSQGLKCMLTDGIPYANF